MLENPAAENPSDVFCVLHPTAAASMTCARCGNFMCVGCSVHGSQTMCPTCRERVGLAAWPFQRDQSLDGLFDFVWKRFTPHWLMLSLTTLVYFGCISCTVIPGLVVGQLFPLRKLASPGSGVGTMAASILGLAFGQILQQAVTAVLTVGFYAVARDVLEGQEPRVERLFSQFSKVGTILGSSLLLALGGVIAIGFLAALIYIVPAAFRVPAGVLVGLLGLGLVFYAVPLVFLHAELAFNEKPTSLQVLNNVFTVGSGRRWTMILYLLLCLGMVLIGYIACCVGLFPALALSHLITGGVYLTLRRGSAVDALASEQSRTP